MECNLYNCYYNISGDLIREVQYSENGFVDDTEEFDNNLKQIRDIIIAHKQHYMFITSLRFAWLHSIIDFIL